MTNLRYADDTKLMTESKEELKSFLMRVKEESESASLKLNIKKKTNKQIMAHGPITSRQIEGENVKVVTVFPFLCFKITANGDCSHELENTCFLAGKL